MKKIKAEKFSIKKWRRSHKKYLKWAKRHPVLAWLSPRIHRLPDLPGDIKLSIISFIQRGKKGWSNRDTWGFDYYLSDVISKGVRYLKENIHGHPANLTEGQWIDTLNQIIETFEMTTRIVGSELYLIKDKKDRKKWQKILDEINKEYDCQDRCMTDKEIKDYEKGWKLFKKYFYNLWD